MGRSDKVDAELVAELANSAETLCMDIGYAAEDVRWKGVDFDATMEHISIFIQLSRVAADMASALASHKRMADYRERLERELVAAGLTMRDNTRGDL